MMDPYSQTNIQQKNWRLINGEKVVDHQSFECDVAIIGSGAGGGISAEILSKVGLKVLLIEEGPLRTSEQFHMLEKDAYPDLYQEAAARKTVDKAINIMQGRCVGGSTTVNWTSSFRTPQQTFEHWQQHYAVKNIDTHSMTPWFEWVEKRLNIHPWQMPPNANNSVLKQGMEKLGYHAGAIARNVNGCANLGYCGMGCPINAKQSMLVSTIPTALDQGATLLSRTRAEKLIVKNGKVKAVELRFMDEKGQLRQHLSGHVKARHVILSAGAIGSPAILLRSKMTDPEHRIGKRTCIHPVNISAAIFDKKIAAFSGAPQSIYSDEFQWPENDAMGFKLEVPPMHPLITATMINGFGKEHLKLMKHFAHFQSILALLRDGFHPDSPGGEVSLDDYQYPQLHYPISERIWQTFKKAYGVMMEVQFAAGAKKVMPIHLDASLCLNWQQAKKMLNNLPMKPLRPRLFSAHLMGGCAMGEDPSIAVVNSQLQYHHAEGLSIIDGSVFPTSLGVNPQLSIYALSARQADHLARQLKPDTVSILKQPL